MRLLITGCSGFIGTELGRRLREEGHSVVSLSRQPPPAHAWDAHHAWQLLDDVPGVALEGVDGVIHLAHDFSDGEGARRSVEGSRKAAEQCLRQGVRRQFYVSSCSASPAALSVYGRAKHTAEQHLSALGDMCIVRPGLVLGAGGLYGRMQRWVERFRIVPLPDGGRMNVPVIEIGDLVGQLLQALQLEQTPAAMNAFEFPVATLRSVVERAAAGKRIQVVPVPSSLVLAGLEIARCSGLRLPVSADNLRGLLNWQAQARAPGWIWRENAHAA